MCVAAVSFLLPVTNSFFSFFFAFFLSRSIVTSNMLLLVIAVKSVTTSVLTNNTQHLAFFIYSSTIVYHVYGQNTFRATPIQTDMHLVRLERWNTMCKAHNARRALLNLRRYNNICIRFKTLFFLCRVEEKKSALFYLLRVSVRKQFTLDRILCFLKQKRNTINRTAKNLKKWRGNERIRRRKKRYSTKHHVCFYIHCEPKWMRVCVCIYVCKV